MNEQQNEPKGETAAWENPVRQSLKNGTPVVGVTLSTTSVEIAAQVADMGFDFLWIEMEHSPITLETARHMILATRGSRTMPFIRVPVNEPWMAKRVMDMGALGVIFPFINSAEGAKRAADACKYPPLGLRGSGAGLATFRWPAPGGYYDFADKNVMVVTNIEEAAAVENIDAIADTPGIDVLFIGTSDLSFSLGLRGRQDEPAFTASDRQDCTRRSSRRESGGAPFDERVAVSKICWGWIHVLSSTNGAQPARRGRRGLPEALEQVASVDWAEAHVLTRCGFGSNTSGGSSPCFGVFLFSTTRIEPPYSPCFRCSNARCIFPPSNWGCSALPSPGCTAFARPSQEARWIECGENERC